MAMSLTPFLTLARQIPHFATFYAIKPSLSQANAKF